MSPGHCRRLRSSPPLQPGRGGGGGGGGALLLDALLLLLLGLGALRRRTLQRRSRARWRCGRAAVQRRACGEARRGRGTRGAGGARLRRLRRAQPSIRLGRCGGFGLCLRSRRGLGRCRPGCPCFVLGGRLRCSLCTAPGWRGVAGRRGRVLVRDLAEVVRGVLERAVHLIATLPPASTDGGRARRAYHRTALRRAQGKQRTFPVPTKAKK